ncbi:MAG: DoxX family protein [Gammaproteobacteria bacterium]
MKYAYNTLDVIGRILLAYFFIPSGITKITEHASIAALMAGHGVPTWLLPFACFLEIVGGLAILTGWYTRIAAFLLGGYAFIAIAIFWGHPFSPSNIIQTAELAAAGGVWVLAAHGAGAWSIDAFLGRRRGTPQRAAPATT